MVDGQSLTREAIALMDVGRFHASGFGIYLGLSGVTLLVRDPSLIEYVAAGFIGLTVNHVAFAVNNLSDRDVDACDPRRRYSPLVSLQTTPLRAWASVAIASVAAIGFALSIYSPGAIYVSLLIGMTIGVSWFQKRTNPWLMDFAYACIFPLTLLVASFVVPLGARLGVPWAVCLALAALALQMNLCGNLKDLTFDSATRFRTIAKETGSRVDASGRMVLTPQFAAFAIGLQVIFYLSLILGQLDWKADSSIGIIVGVALIAGCAALSSNDLAKLVRGRSVPNSRGNERFLWLNVIIYVGIVSAHILGISVIGFSVGLIALILPAVLRRYVGPASPRSA
ncbi:UbiA family prenyltransferase [Agromyces sp. M3QZ16-3]|uniref:UbiA family prenyltransferase n=1 Tax=Agromyces sp. M3QZ16-3 TaxID=3447585 RepID=UPI003F6947BE